VPGKTDKERSLRVAVDEDHEQQVIAMKSLTWHGKADIRSVPDPEMASERHRKTAAPGTGRE